MISTTIAAHTNTTVLSPPQGKEDLDKVTQEYCDRTMETCADGPVPLLFISFPSAKDPLWDKKHPGKR